MPRPMPSTRTEPRAIPLAITMPRTTTACATDSPQSKLENQPKEDCACATASM